MTTIEPGYSGAEKTQRMYARLAGFVFLSLIITGLAGALTIPHIVGTGTFAETAKRVVASEHLYRVALSSELIETLSTVLLAFALHVTLKPIDKLLATIAMCCRGKHPELSVGLRKSGLGAGGGSEAVALGHPIEPVRDGFVSRFVPLDR